jgi:phosphatidylserine/phosphatidylglycerophosphate/cardiolipin synthase-like enzyme
MPTMGFSKMTENSFANKISSFVQKTPSELVQMVIKNLDNCDEVPTSLQKTKVISCIQSPNVRADLSNLITLWEKDFPEVKASSISLAMRSVLVSKAKSDSPSFELIWTGPENITTTFRRTDQALLELIQGAQKSLLIVSFAVYKAQPIIKAIENAIQRNVKVVICLEDSEASQGKVSYSGINAFSESIFKVASIYTWPIQNRPHTEDGKYGSLHAKVAVADQEKVFISSANLTDYAMDLNMEMGILINSKTSGEQIDRLIQNMIVNFIFRKIPIRTK